MFTYLSKIAKTKTSKDTLIVLIGTIINVIAGGLFFVFVPRILGPEEFGLFSTVIATGLLAASVANFGMDSGILKFAHKGAKDAQNFLSIAFKTYLVTGAAIAIVGFLISPQISIFLDQPRMTPLLRIGFVGIIFLLLANFFVVGLQAKQEFLKASIVNISSNVMRLIVLVVGLYFFSIGLHFLTFLYFFITIVSIIFGKIFLPLNLKVFDKIAAINLYKYNSWVGLSTVIATIPIDNYLLLKFAGPAETGIYAAPYKILTFAYQFGGNFTSVLASRFSTFDTKEKVKEFSKKAALLISTFGFGLILVALVADPLIKILFGPEFESSILVMRVLVLGFIFFFATIIPSSIILYFFGKSRISFYITMLRVLVFSSALFVLVPEYKAVGGALAFTISEIITFLLMGTYTVYRLKAKA